MKKNLDCLSLQLVEITTKFLHRFGYALFQLVNCYKSLGYEVSVNNVFKRYDYVIYFRGTSQKDFVFIKLLKKLSKKVYWDTCVNYFEKHYSNKFQQVQYAKRIAKTVDGIIVPSEPLYQIAIEHNQNVHIMHDAVDVDVIPQTERPLNLENPRFG